MGKLNIPDSRKIFGCNLVPKQADISGGRSWENMILSWDWDGWIKPQIDYLVGNNLGCNAVRMIGGVYGIVAGIYTQEFYDARYAQLADYCAMLGVYLYAGAGYKGTLNSIPISNDNLANIMATSLLKIQAYPNIIGVDLIQEANVNANPNNANLIDIIRRVKAAGITLPITCSTAEINVSSAASAPWITAMAPYFDFIDVHAYSAPYTMQSMDYLRAAFPEKDILLGEFGRAQSIAEDTQLVDLKTVFDLMNSGDRRIRGGLRWASFDHGVGGDPSAQWGAYSADFIPRQRQLNLMRRYTGGNMAILNSKLT